MWNNDDIIFFSRYMIDKLDIPPEKAIKGKFYIMAIIIIQANLVKSQMVGSRTRVHDLNEICSISSENLPYVCHN